jgi:Tfp pilus assembly protein PilZ
MDKGRAFYFRRVHKRRPVDVPIGSICHGQGYFERALELSIGGLLVRSEFQYKIGDNVEVGFFLNEKDFVAGITEVVYVIECNSESRLAGMKFSDASPTSLEAIQRYVDTDARQTRIVPFRSKDSDLIYGSPSRHSVK